MTLFCTSTKPQCIGRIIISIVSESEDSPIYHTTPILHLVTSGYSEPWKTN
jgi:hypothetical protein